MERPSAGPRAHLPLLLLGSVVLAWSLGCTLFRSERAVADDAETWLEATYGEPFEVREITRARGVYGEPAPLKDVFRFQATPVNDPDLGFDGTIDYRFDELLVIDDYRCLQLRRWLPEALEDRLGDRIRLVSVELSCDRKHTPTHPEPDEPLPKGTVRLFGEVHSFREGDPEAVAQEAAQALRTEAEAMGVRVKASAVSVAPGAWPAAEQWRETGAGVASAEDWEPLIRGRIELDGTRPFDRWDRVPALEAQVETAIRRTHPDARLSVWARTGPVKNRRFVDIRVARPGLGLSDAEQLVAMLEIEVKWEFWSLTVLDKEGPDAPQHAAWVCRKPEHACVASDWPLIDPADLKPSGALEGE